MLTDVKPHLIDFSSERSDHLGHDVDQEAELPLDGRARYRGGSGHSVSQPVRPLRDHRIAHFRDHTTSREQRRLRSAHYVFSLVKVRQSTPGLTWGQNHSFDHPGSPLATASDWWHRQVPYSRKMI